MSKQKQEIIVMAKRMFKHACAFMDCTYFCHTEIKGSGFNMTQFLGIPDIVLSCFSCEVYLKSLLLLQGESIDDVRKMKHHIQSLWDRYEQVDPVSAQSFLHIFEEFGSKSYFDEAIMIIDNNFQDVRYLYEDVEGNTKSNRTFLLYFCRCLREFCCYKIHGCSWDDFVKAGCNW
ncbi:hypothetical protein [Aristaeella hokkaidonensis]|uniref:Uncharacterized protein n=1 Tax=Aristaeella hokkaidonensis TaxID=3046382 RepID=A0AC61MVA2_9FIRM|nr:hypothetical protein [Aristaeella hokkaidonensis]QUC66122.1 hypothetical protein JYE49_09600 [Aristaeella hokkaidonensis]SNT94872.1 hypothetical protein SAMN06297421_107101 [Aristaeella hokkaidonensis]